MIDLAYSDAVSSNLLNLPICEGINCKNCNCNIHQDSLNKLCTGITKACVDAAEKTLPVSGSATRGDRHNVVIGWNEHVEPFRKKSLLWHKIWLDNNKPKSGLVADIMRSTRCQYHSQVKWVKQNIRFIQSQKMAKSMVEGKTSDFWAEVKRIRGCKATVTASVDGEVDDGCIADLFANKYKTLYNSVSYDPTELRKIHHTVDAIILDKCEKSIITIDDVRTSIASLKPGKADGRDGVLTDHMIHGGNNLHVHLCQLFNSMLIHGMSPSSLQSSTLVPIPKDKRKSLSLSDNYRAIALSSPICKVLDTVILRKYGDLLSTCDLQNGFKEHGSTNACTSMVKETIQYYLQNGSNVFGTVLDATKAFDRIDFCKLFREMIIRKIPPLVIRLIMEMYEKQSMAVRWNNEYSDSFGVSNGVKQGGVLSPILFCIYIDNLLMSLKKNDIGCHIGSHFCGAFGYADDIMLLSPSVSGLQNMLDCCSEFASTYNVKFNPSKSKCITFSQKKNIGSPELYMNDIKLDNVQLVKHLGHIITSDLTDDKDIMHQTSMYNRKANAVLSDFKHISGDLRVQIMQSYCSSFYGSQLWDLSNTCIDRLSISWRKSIRKALNVPARTHSVYLPLICECLPLNAQLELRVMKFYMNGINSTNRTFRFLSNHACMNRGSTIGKNINYIMWKYDIPPKMCRGTYVAVNKLITKWYNNNIKTDDDINASIIAECIMIRDNTMTCNTMNQCDANDIVMYLTTM